MHRRTSFGDDGVAGSAEISTKSGNYVQPVVKLFTVFGAPLSGMEDVVCNENCVQREFYAATSVSEYILILCAAKQCTIAKLV